LAALTVWAPARPNSPLGTNATDAALAPVSQVALDEFAHVLSQGNQDHGGGSGEASSRLAKIAYFEEHDFKRAISLTTKKPNSSQRNKS